ncbi:MAG: glycosyltransferase family 39 protein [bacterium]|nr:glycosyltransferase family 39 protein [bacterium]
MITMPSFHKINASQLYIFIALVVLLLAFATRIHNLGAQSLWHDEGNSYVQSTRTFFDIAANAGRDIHPPGYYWLLGGWRLLAGDSEFALRALSVFASVLGVAFTYALGGRLYHPLAGLCAAAFVALNTFSIYYAQEARMYALLALWAAAAMWALAGVLKPSSPRPPSPSGRRGRKAILQPGERVAPLVRPLLLLALFNAAGLWTQYAYAFVLLAQGIIVVLWCAVNLVSGRRGLVARMMFAYVAANLLTLLLYAPWIPTAYQQLTTWPNTGDAIPDSEALSVILGWFAFGITTASGTTLSAAFFLLFGLLVFSSTAQATPSSPRRISSFPVGLRMLFPVLWTVVPVSVFLAFGLFREANLKFLLPAQIAFALWMGRGVWMLGNLPVRRDRPIARLVPVAAAALGVFALLSALWGRLNILYTSPEYQRDDYRTIAARITTELDADDAIILNAPNQQEVFGYYYEDDTLVFPLPRGLGGDDAATVAELRQIIDDHDRIYAVLWGVDERDPNNIVEATLDQEAFEADNTWYGDVRLVRYASPADFPAEEALNADFGDSITLSAYALNGTTFAPGEMLQARLLWRTDTPLTTRYKVFVQLLDSNGRLAAQRDAEPGGNMLPTTGWTPRETVQDHHALALPLSLPPGDYTLIVGLYDLNNPNARLPVGDGDFLTLATITLTPAQN